MSDLQWVALSLVIFVAAVGIICPPLMTACYAILAAGIVTISWAGNRYYDFFDG